MPQGALPARIVNSAAIGNSWFVNETTGSDSNPGNAELPFASLAAAQAAAVAKNNDVVYLIGSCHLSASLSWAKDGVSLVGLSAPSDNDRSRISVASGLTQTQVTALHPLVNVTAQGCSFVNIGTFYGFDGALTPPTSPVCWNEAGGRNFYSNVQFLGGGDALMGALAAMRSLTITGGGENLFVGCTLGLDTVPRITNANATLELLSGTTRNTFRQCTWQALSQLAGNCHVKVGASGMDRYCWFQDCFFDNAIDSTATAMDVAFLVNSAAGGHCVLGPGCLSVGSTLIATTGPVYGAAGALGASTWGLGLHLT